MEDNYTKTYIAKWNGKDCFCEISLNTTSWLANLYF